MKVVAINSVSNGSTGSIMLNIHNALLNNGIESYAIWGRGRKSRNSNEIYLNDKLGVYFHKINTLFTDKTGFYSIKSTKKLLKKLDKINPNIIHLHNIHGYYLNIELLFNYIKEKKIKVIWTLHDCWPFVGHCSYFTYANCEKWKIKCSNCPKYKEYPKSFIDNSSWCYEKKKEIFNGVDDLTIVTPSEWLTSLVKQSFLKKYPTITINNGIDTNIFKKIKKDEIKFRNQYHLDNKKIILGVASQFTKRKGLKDFLELSKIINSDYIIVLVGLNKNQIKKLPNNIIGIQKTNNVYELVDIYNSADIFLNLTYEDNYPTVNLEAIACGTPVLTYDTGGSVEFVKYISNDGGKYIIKKNDISKNKNALKKRIEEILNENNFNLINPNLIDKKKMIDEYISLYNKQVRNNK